MSVLLPFRDARATLAVAVASVLRQTHEDLELLLVDDGSSDGSEALAREVSRRDGRVRVLRREGAGDLVGALELGRAAARAPWIARMDADDLAHPARIERCLRVIEADPRLAVVSCLVRSFPSVLVRGGRTRYDAWLNGLRRHEDMARERFVESPLAHPSALLRASALREAGGYRAFAGPEDYDLWLRLFAAGWRFAKVPALLHFWREGPARLSRVDERYGRAGMTRARTDALAREVSRREVVLAGAGRAGRQLGRALLERGVSVAFFLDVDPRKVGRERLGRPVLGVEEGLRRRGDALVLGCVNGWGRRSALRGLLRERGLVETRDFYLAG